MNSIPLITIGEGLYLPHSRYVFDRTAKAKCLLVRSSGVITIAYSARSYSLGVVHKLRLQV